MAHSPTLHHRLPNRAVGAFGASAVGRVAEWLTATWLRFEATLTWFLVIAVITMSSQQGAIDLVALLLMSPFSALLLLFVFKAFGWLTYLAQVPLLSSGLGLARLAFLWTFSRLIVEPAPSVEMPLWIGR